MTSEVVRGWLDSGLEALLPSVATGQLEAAALGQHAQTSPAQSTEKSFIFF